MARHERGIARRRPVRALAGRRRGGRHDLLIARRRTLPPAVNLPEMVLLARLARLLLDPPSTQLH